MTSISTSGERNTWGIRVISEDASQSQRVVKTCKGCPSLTIAGKTTLHYECTLLHSVLQADLHPVCGQGEKKE